MGKSKRKKQVRETSGKKNKQSRRDKKGENKNKARGSDQKEQQSRGWRIRKTEKKESRTVILC